MNKPISCLLTLCLFLAASFAEAQELKPAPVFSDHMILQQDKPLHVFGKASAGSKVTVSLNKKTAKTVVSADGTWQVTLPKQKASFSPTTLTISSGKEKVQYTDVLIGEVWVAAGQSNMEYTMKLRSNFQKPYKGEDYAALELQKSENKNIRVLNCPHNGKPGTWQRADGKSLEDTSAPGYFCVKHLQDSLQVPVGLITNAIGGTMVEQWYVDADCYNRTVKQYVPFTVRGFLWYQGEQNCTASDKDYVQKFQRLAAEWRKVYGVSDDAPFLTVMLAPFRYSAMKHRAGYVDAEELPKFRLQQMECVDSVTNTEIIFCPETVDDLDDIHPSYKWDVGKRLALLALNKTYGHTADEWSGPRADTVSVIDGEIDTLCVHFTHTADGLVNPSSVKSYKYGPALPWFEVMDSKGVWHAAIATYADKENVKVWCRYVKHPSQVRYLWHETATSVGLKNSLGFCAFPFVLKVKSKPTIFSIGDSTMANKGEGTEEAGWAQLMNEHLTDAIRVDNHAQNGRSSKSFIDEGRWQKVVDLLQPGDYVFIQFGHNDEKADAKRHTDPETTFKDNLRKFITEAEDKGANPILFNSMVRRKFEGDKLINTHGDYIKAPFEVAEEMGVPCIDAESLSKKLVESLGPEDSKKLFMWFPPEKKDDTHLNHYGARQMSKLFLDALAERLPSFKQYMK